MNAKVRDLEGWDEFATNHLAGGPKFRVAADLQLFRSRWRLASNFEGFDAAGLSDGTVSGYAAAFKVFLAYSAHELLASSIGISHTELPAYENPPLASEIREQLHSLRRLTLDNAQGQQATWLGEFWDSKSDDLRPFAYGIRNVVAHGPFTSNKVKAAKAQKTLLAVAEYMLTITEAWFQHWAEVLDAELSKLSN